MTSLASTLDAPAARNLTGRWLFGPVPDLLLGYGLAYLVSVPVLLTLGTVYDVGSGALQASTLLAMVVSLPHYGATILRVYERRRESRKYVHLALWATLLVVALFIGALYSVRLGSLLITAYVTWGIWHFSAQNYGIAVLYLRRSGVETDPIRQRPLHRSFVFSALLAILASHVASGALTFSPQSSDPSGTFQVFHIGIPAGFRLILGVALVAGYLGSLGWALHRFRGTLSAASLTPIGLLLTAQAMWYTVPAIGSLTGVWQPGRLGYAFAAIWISTAHAAQYLWVTCYFAQRDRACASIPTHLSKCMLAGAAVTGPGLLFAPGLFGGVTAHSTSVVVLVFAVVNLHHFLLDSVIWRLRDRRVAKVLVDSVVSEPDPEPIRDWRWLRIGVCTLGAAVLLQQSYGAWCLQQIYGEASTSVKHSAAKHLYWLGLDTPEVWILLGQSAEEELVPTVAIEAYRNAMDILGDASPAPVVSRLAWLLLARDDPRQVEEATQLATLLTELLRDERPEGYQTLARAYAAEGRWQDAAVAAEQALWIARQFKDGARIHAIRQALVEYRAAVVATRRAGS